MKGIKETMINQNNICTGVFGEYCPWCSARVGEPHGKHYFV